MTKQIDNIIIYSKNKVRVEIDGIDKDIVPRLRKELDCKQGWHVDRIMNHAPRTLEGQIIEDHYTITRDRPVQEGITLESTDVTYRYGGKDTHILVLETEDRQIEFCKAKDVVSQVYNKILRK